MGTVRGLVVITVGGTAVTFALGRLAWARGLDLLSAAVVRPDDGVAVGVLAVGAAVAAWYALTGAAGLVAHAGVAPRVVAALVTRYGAPVLRRLAATTAAAGVGLGALGGAAAGAELPPDLGWGAPQPAPASAPAAPPAAPLERSSTAPAGAVPASPVPAGAASTGPAPRPVAPAPEAGQTYVVTPGDSLWSIAAEHLEPGASAAQVAAAWPRWYAANRDVIGPDPDLIHPGQLLLAPTEEDRS